MIYSLEIPTKLFIYLNICKIKHSEFFPIQHVDMLLFKCLQNVRKIGFQKVINCQLKKKSCIKSLFGHSWGSIVVPIVYLDIFGVVQSLRQFNLLLFFGSNIWLLCPNGHGKLTRSENESCWIWIKHCSKSLI